MLSASQAMLEGGGGESCSAAPSHLNIGQPCWFRRLFNTLAYYRQGLPFITT